MSDSEVEAPRKGFLAWWRTADYAAKAGVIGTVVAVIALIWGLIASGSGDCIVEAEDSNVACGDQTIEKSD